MFFALEGPDGSGKSTICEHLQSKHNFHVISNPYDGYFRYGFIEIMNDNCFNVISRALMYCWYFAEVKSVITNALKEHKNVVLDRYYLSTYIYNCYGAMPTKNIFYKIDNPERRFVKRNIGHICAAYDNSLTDLGKAIGLLALIADCDHELSMFFKDIRNTDRIKEVIFIIFAEYKENNVVNFKEIKFVLNSICKMIDEFLPKVLRLDSSDNEYIFRYCFVSLLDVLFKIIDLPEPYCTFVFQKQIDCSDSIGHIVKCYNDKNMVFNTVKGNVIFIKDVSDLNEYSIFHNIL